MKKFSKLLIVTAFVLGVAWTGAYLFTKSGSVDDADPQIVTSQGLLAFDPTDLRSVAGFFNEIFVGRVTEVLGTGEEDGQVVTKYKVSVIRSLKGEAGGEIIVRQFGGFYKQKWYISHADIGLASENLPTDVTDGYTLTAGKTYLFTTRHSGVRPEYTMSSMDVGRIDLGISAAGSLEEASAEAGRNERVRFMENAIANQIPSPHSLE